MKNCWAVLGIDRTTDLRAIKRARRSLIKIWHPDTVATPGEKQTHTDRCMQINAAYDQAVKVARSLKGIARNSFRKDAEARQNDKVHTVRSHFGSIGSRYDFAITGALLFFVFSIKAFVSLFVALVFVSVLLAGLAFIGIMDLLFVDLAVRPVLFTVSSLVPAMHRHEKKVVWCVVLLFNGLALHFGLSIVGINLFAELLGFVFVRNSG